MREPHEVTAAAAMDLAARAEQVIMRCRKLASFSEDGDGTRRTFLSPPMHDCHREIAEWLKPLGISPTVDGIGNLRAYYPGSDPKAGRLLIGSHLDTVPNAGAFDGILGVIIAIALVEALQGKKLHFGLEIVGFSEEEGVRFSVPFLGSRALAGTMDDALLAHTDTGGVSVQEAIRQFGLDPQDIPKAALSTDAVAYLEFHIEQGPVLEHVGVPLAAVDTIVGQSRFQFTFTGKSNHAGTTPMNLRRDALAAAAEWIVAVEDEAGKVPGLVATVGAIETKPGAVNVIAGEVRVSLDVRHASDDVRRRAAQTMIEQAKKVAERRGLSVSETVLLEQDAVAMDGGLIVEVESAIRESGCEPHRMASGAGHDAMILAKKIPTAMIFLRSPGGISHHPAESVRVEDVAKALECGRHLLEHLENSWTLPR